ncbi:MAG: serine hydrolase [Candidatus Yanofskybacteria bacterium]|nr:serine hydrolase [Candidatus Yanofskybacteria bacterium]
MANKFNIIDINLFCNQSRFKFINKELACDNSFVIKKHAYADLKSRIEEFIDSKIKEKEITNVSIYFRDLVSGPTLGIDDHAVFAPASLLKVPLLITYLNFAEDKPELLEKKLTYHTTKEVIFEQLISPKESIQENESYSVNDLLKRLIKYSDNKAYIVLTKYLIQAYPNTDVFTETIQDLGIVSPRGERDEVISVKSYSSIFIQLYHASFFRNKETSEKTLEFLANTDFNIGIVAGVPPEISVAHKFGERTGFEGGIKQLHDCGIVYYPKNPYLLCVMTRGHDIEKLSNVIGAISKMFYEEFDSRRL